jgi:hypothetical protein
VYQATYERLSPRDRERGATLPSAARGREILFVFPLEAAQRPLFQLLGTPADDRHHDP